MPIDILCRLTDMALSLLLQAADPASTYGVTRCQLSAMMSACGAHLDDVIREVLRVRRREADPQLRVHRRHRVQQLREAAPRPPRLVHAAEALRSGQGVVVALSQTHER